MKSITLTQPRRTHMVLLQCLVLALMAVLFTHTALAEKVNVNEADAMALQYIPGIGPSKAADIIRHREQVGGFKSFEQMLEAPGVGPGTLEEIKLHGTLEGGVSVLTQEMQDNPPARRSATASHSGADESSG